MVAGDGAPIRSGRQAARARNVYERLRQAVLSLELLPGERISERALERLLGVSRTPIRQALQRLEGEGLVVRQAGGQMVAPVDLAELLEAFEFREGVEAMAVRLACIHADAASLIELQALLDEGLHDSSAETWMRIGTEVHIRLAALSGNRFVRRAVEDVVTRIERARWMMAVSPKGRADAHHEHSTILRLIGERQSDAAAQAVVAHGRAVRDTLVAAIRSGRPGLRARGMDVIDPDIDLPRAWEPEADP